MGKGLSRTNLLLELQDSGHKLAGLNQFLQFFWGIARIQLLEMLHDRMI